VSWIILPDAGIVNPWYARRYRCWYLLDLLDKATALTLMARLCDEGAPPSAFPARPISRKTLEPDCRSLTTCPDPMALIAPFQRTFVRAYAVADRAGHRCLRASLGAKVSLGWEFKTES